jgi:hypothetical protein
MHACACTLTAGTPHFSLPRGGSGTQTQTARRTPDSGPSSGRTLTFRTSSKTCLTACSTRTQRPGSHRKKSLSIRGSTTPRIPTRKTKKRPSHFYLSPVSFRCHSLLDFADACCVFCLCAYVCCLLEMDDACLSLPMFAACRTDFIGLGAVCKQTCFCRCFDFYLISI